MVICYQVLGCDQFGLHSHKERSENSRNDCGCMVCGAYRFAGPAVWLEGPGLFGPYQHPTAMHGQSGHWLSDICYVFHVLRASVGHTVPVLEDIQNSQATDSPEKGSKERHARTLQVRHRK